MAVIDGKWLSKEGLTYFWSKIKSIFTKQTETNVIANLGAKNLLNNQYLTTASGTGVTIIDNNDGTYNLSGTATGAATYLYTSSADFSSLYGIETGKSYTITAGSNKVLIRIDYSTNGTSWDNGEDGQPLVSNIAGEATFTAPASTIGLYIRFRSTASHGSLNGVVLKPMVRPAEITDDTFQPYTKTNHELTVAEDEDREALMGQVDSGAKNLAVPLNLTARSDLTITNDKGQYTITGTTTSAFTGYLFRPAEPFQITTDCVIIGAEQLTGLNYNVAYKKSAGSNTRYEGIGTKKILPSGAVILYIYVQQNTIGTAVSAKINLMLCTAADYAISPAFVPYAPTNRELYETRFASKTILPNNVDLNNIKTGGIYNGVISTGNSAVHMPVATGSFNFVLTVVEANESIIQIFKQLNSAGDPNLYIRRFYIYNSDWDSWYQFTGTQV